jgi:hypothetical protein
MNSIRKTNIINRVPIIDKYVRHWIDKYDEEWIWWWWIWWISDDFDGVLLVWVCLWIESIIGGVFISDLYWWNSGWLLCIDCLSNSIRWAIDDDGKDVFISLGIGRIFDLLCKRRRCCVCDCV